MRIIIIVALVIALLLVVVGAADHGTHVDVGYLFGTWHQASLLSLFTIAAGLVLIAGLVGLVMVPLLAARSRRTLEAELESIYLRLRAAESAAVAPATLATPQTPTPATLPTAATAESAAPLLEAEAVETLADDMPESAVERTADVATETSPEPPADEQKTEADGDAGSPAPETTVVDAADEPDAGPS